MECAAVGILALSGVAAIVAMLALAFGGQVVAALDSAFSKWRRLGFLGRIVTAAMVVVATVEAQKGESEKSKSQVEVEQRTSNNSAVQLGLPTSTHFLVSVKTNTSYSYEMPANATLYTNWWMRGGYEDVFRLDLGSWRFPLGTTSVSSLWVYTFGKTRWHLRDFSNEVAAIGAPMSAVPQVSQFWHMDGTNSSKILTWHNFFVGRIPISELDGSELDFSRVERVDRVDWGSEELKSGVEVEQRTNKLSSVQLRLETSTIISTVPISAQLELFPNGDYIARSNLVERYYKRINPDDWDDDGIPNDADVNPSESDGDFFGHQEDELPEGAETSNYCWVDIVVSNANSLVTFVGDKPSNLPDPRFIAKAGENYRVNLLIGKTYRVSSALPIFCMAKSSDEIYVSGEGTKEMTVVYPVSYEIMDNARSVSSQVRMIPPLVGTFNWASTDRCCDIGNVSGTWIPLCSSGCSCEGCTSGGFTFNYEGYSLSFDGLECGCKSYSGPTEDDGPYDASVSVAFSEKAIIFENAYENKPGDSVPKQSTRTVLSCVAHGGPNGGRARFTISNAEKLVRLSGIDLPMEVDVPAGNKVEFNIVYEGGEASGSENDIVATAQFIDNKDGALGSVEDELTVVKVELSPVNSIDECYNRHKWGICEKVLLEWSPVVDGLGFTIAGDGIVNTGERGETFAFFDCPTIQMSDILSIVYKDSSYVVASQVFAPSMIIARNPQELKFDIAYGYPGGVGMQMDLYVLPDNVSFQWLSFMEVPSVESDIGGYFTNSVFSSVWYHTENNGAGEWHNIKPENFFFTDGVMMGDRLILPWSEGYISWNIPIKGKRKRDDCIVLDNTINYRQEFVMYGDGSLRVSKFGFWVQRNPYNERTRSSGVKRWDE